MTPRMIQRIAGLAKELAVATAAGLYFIVVMMVIAGVVGGGADLVGNWIKDFKAKRASTVFETEYNKRRRDQACQEHKILLAILAQKASQYSSYENAKVILQEDFRKLGGLHRICEEDPHW